MSWLQSETFCRRLVLKHERTANPFKTKLCFVVWTWLSCIALYALRARETIQNVINECRFFEEEATQDDTQRVISFETSDIINVKSYKILVLVVLHNSSIAGQLLRASIMHSSSMAQQSTMMFLLCIMNYPELELPLFIKRLGKTNIEMPPAQGETGEKLMWRLYIHTMKKSLGSNETLLMLFL